MSGAGRPNLAFLADGRGFAYVASDGETVVGFAWGSTVSQPDGGQLLFLAGLQVAEAVRSTKVGKQLLDASLRTVAPRVSPGCGC